MERYLCRCGYIYDAKAGDEKAGIAPGTSFDSLPESWICPLCGLPKANFTLIGGGMITVGVKCFTTLAKEGSCDYKGSTHHVLPERSTVRDLVEKLQLPVDAIHVIFINNLAATADTVLKSGDEVGFSPKVGSM